ncbi:hypothetical protein DL96DRAFT_1710047 [Flagelloscypha sp. PMI_526]|nr:hypothetical protein DL96DRAFT_1710047 [Flagelloscypha sp. PMI_526]
MTIDRLPAELYRPILCHISLDRETLAMLCLASPALRCEAEPLLYTKIRDVDLLSQLLLHRTVTTTPRLARLVRSYSQFDDWNRFYAGPIAGGHVNDNIVEQFWTVHVPEMLRTFTGLTSLSLRSLRGGLKAEMVCRCQFQLESLYWPYAGEAKFISFLQTQEKLSTLMTEWDEDLPPPSPNFMPKLTHLIADSGFPTVQKLLPGRSIQHLVWIPNIHTDPLDTTLPRDIIRTPGLPLALSQLNRLRIGGYFGGPMIETIISFIKNVRTLELVGVSGNGFACINQLSQLQNLLFLQQRTQYGSFPLPVSCGGSSIVG